MSAFPKVKMVAACLAAGLLIPGVALGDVTVERFMKSGGLKGIGANESTIVDRISGLRKREASAVKMTGSIGKFFGGLVGDMSTDTITDIDRDVVWSLDHKKKTYTEAPITLPKMKEEEAAGERPGREEKPKVRVTRNEITVRETGEKKTINGFDTNHYVITWLLEAEDIESGAKSRNIMTTDLWNTPETAETRALQEEESAFSRAYMKKLGLDMTDEDTRKLGLAVVAGLFGGDEASMKAKVKELGEKMSKVKGYPIVTAVKWEMESEGGAAEAQQSAREEEGGSGGLDLSKGLGGFLGGLAKKAAKGSGEKSAAPAQGSVLFDSYAEVKKIDASPIPGSEFEVPAGYKLVK